MQITWNYLYSIHLRYDSDIYVRSDQESQKHAEIIITTDV